MTQQLFLVVAGVGMQPLTRPYTWESVCKLNGVVLLNNMCVTQSGAFKMLSSF